MRVLLIDVNCKYSSTGKIVYSLYQAARANGDEAAICYGRGPLINEENIYRFSPPAEVYVHALLTRITGLTGCFSPLATRNLIRYMEQYRPDVVHIHELHAYFVNLAPVISYLKGKHIPTVWTFHCEFMYTGKCGYSYECEKWKMGCGHCPRLREYPETFFLDFTDVMWKEKKRLMEKWPELLIATPSEWLRDRVKASLCNRHRVQTVYNGVDMALFSPNRVTEIWKNYAVHGEKIVLAVAPDLLSSRKGGQWILALAEMMKEEAVHFFMVGVTPEQEKKYRRPANVTMIARTKDQKELAQYYSSADAFLICSEQENFPTTCLEALACGTPVCGWDTGGTKETDPEHPERFVEFGNLDALRGVLEQVLREPKGNTKKWDSRVMTEQYLDIYRELDQRAKGKNLNENSTYSANGTLYRKI